MGMFRKKPVTVEATLWRGGEYGWLDTFCGLNWGRADAHDVAWPHNDKEQVVVWNCFERQWLCVPVGHWVIRGVRGELYSCEPGVFAATYESVDPTPTPQEETK